MTTHFGSKLQPAKGVKRLNKLLLGLQPGEEVFYMTKCVQMRPAAADLLIVTSHRLAAVFGEKITAEFPHNRPLTLSADDKKQEVTAQGAHSVCVFRAVAREDHDLLQRTLQWARDNAPRGENQADGDFGAPQSFEDRAKAKNWPNTRIAGLGGLSKKASLAVARLCHDDDPWLILVSSGGAGLLAAWDDRLAIVKTGAVTSFMAGSLGGERSAVFHYTDITGIEYNSGLMSGVLEILTPSYSGGANKDFWRGSTKSRNADSNDPWALSNTLPLMKDEYRAAADQITELRRRISAAKSPPPIWAATPPPQPPSTPAAPGRGAGLAEQLAKLADLHQSGVLSDEEFAAAKQRLLNP